MAEGRMLKNKISVDVRVADLSDDTHRLLFTWGISHLDIAGRISGDPREFKAKVVPMLDHIAKDKVLEFFADAENIGLIERYEVDGKWTVQYPGFTKNQSLRENKEAPSAYPIPSEASVLPDDSGRTPGAGRDKSGRTPLEGKGSKEKGREGKRKKGAAPRNSAPPPAYSCECFEVSSDHLEELVKAFPLMPGDYLVNDFFPRMRDWCLDHRTDAKHRKKFNADGRLKSPRVCLKTWLRNENPDRVPRPLPRGQPARMEPEGIVIPVRGCPECGGGGLTQSGPCKCLHPETQHEPSPQHSATI